MSTLLSLENIHLAYDTPHGLREVVRDFSLSLDRGHIGSLLGASGCGKSTVLRAIAGFEPVRQGQIALDQVVISSPTRHLAPELRRVPVVRYESIKSHANIAQPKTDLNSNRITKTTVGLGANYALSDQWTVLGGVHQGFAPPGSGVGNGTKGEESTNFEGGVRYRQGKLGFDAIGFYSDYTNAMRNCLVANPCPGGATDGTEQTGSKEVYGLELGMFSELHRTSAGSVPVRLAYTYTDGKYTRDSDVAAGVQKGDVLEYTPKHILSAQMGWETAKWKSYVAMNYNSDACTSNTCGRAGVDSRFLKTDSLVTFNLSTAYQVSPAVEIYAKIDNLFDKQRITTRGPDGARGNMGRYAAVGLRAKF